MARSEWEDDAACKSRNSSTFAPLHLKDVIHAQLICRACPCTGRTGACYKAATATDRFWTVRGGQLPEVFDQRRAASNRRLVRYDSNQLQLTEATT